MSYTKKTNRERGYIQDVLGEMGATCTKGLSHFPKSFNMSETLHYLVQVVKPLRTCRDCGLQVFTEKDLDKFAKKREGKYGRDTICKDCLNRRLRKPAPPPLPYLRKCRVCGVEAKTLQDLEKFTINRDSKHDRANLCKQCHNKYILERNKEDNSRIFHFRHKEELIKYFGLPLKCHFCGKEITKLNGQTRDSLVIHSLDGNHDNWNPANKVPTHQHCHVTYHNKGIKKPYLSKRLLSDKKILTFKGKKHSKETIQKMRKAQLGEKHWRWQGDNASKHTKELREWRRKRRDK